VQGAGYRVNWVMVNQQNAGSQGGYLCLCISGEFSFDLGLPMFSLTLRDGAKTRLRGFGIKFIEHSWQRTSPEV